MHTQLILFHSLACLLPQVRKARQDADRSAAPAQDVPAQHKRERASGQMDLTALLPPPHAAAACMLWPFRLAQPFAATAVLGLPSPHQLPAAATTGPPLLQ